MGQLQRFEIGPAHPLVGRTAGTVGLEHLVQGRLQLRFALGDRLTAAAGAAHPLGIAARALRMVRVVLAPLLQLANPGVDRASTHPQHAKTAT